MRSLASTVPGISFETVQPQIEDALPRMDIASFVGFASSGPLHTPVGVESAREFRDIFGSDLSLAWDNELSQTDKSYLGRTVEMFFRNGGRRCWVVRVADESLAQTARFKLSGLIRTDGEKVEQSYAHARSAGGWAEQVSVNTVLQVDQLNVVTQGATISTPSIDLSSDTWFADIISPITQVNKGDLLAVNLAQQNSLFYLLVETVEANTQGVRVSGTSGYYHVTEISGAPAQVDESLALPNAVDLAGFSLFKLADIVSQGVQLQWPNVESSTSPPSISLLKYQIIAQGPDAQTRQISDLGFSASHDRFWGYLPSDTHLYRHGQGRAVTALSKASQTLLDQATEPRFPLAASEEVGNWQFIPHAMDLFINTESRTQAEFADTGDRLRREGIESFDAQLFLDSRLINMQSDTLRREANALAYLSESPTSEPLRGVHSLLLIDEVSIVAVPDAVHRNWNALPPPFRLPLAAPILENIIASSTPGDYMVSWGLNTSIGVNATSNIAAYTLEWSRDPNFENAQGVNLTGDVVPGSWQAADLLPEPPLEHTLHLGNTCPFTYYFRVRAERQGEISTWSKHLAVTIPESDFANCSDAQASTLGLSLSLDASGSPSLESPLLRWEFDHSVDLGADYFEVQQSGDRLFGQVEWLSNADDQSAIDGEAEDSSPSVAYMLSIDDLSDSIRHFRVRAVLRNTVGPWSNTLSAWPASLNRTSLEAAEDFSGTDLLAIHRAVLRCCSARGDLFGVLGLPRHYHEQDVLDHYAKLMPGDSLAGSTGFDTVPPLTLAESPAASHAALYYSWLISPSESTGGGKIELQSMPPEGPICGKLAARAMSDGAWVAPANSPLTDVLALTSPVSDSWWLRLNRSRINVLRSSVDGIVTLSANTLSNQTDLREINVRRLLSLLRRLALREGNRYVFEPNNAAFQERVQQHFETVFGKLFERGAFSGVSASQAYRVVTDTSVNTERSIDAGRFVVELWVAPSQALKFIRVRLTQSGPSQLQVQEV